MAEIMCDLMCLIYATLHVPHPRFDSSIDRLKVVQVYNQARRGQCYKPGLSPIITVLAARALERAL